MEEKLYSSTSRFSVSMCVYEKDNPSWFRQAIDSLIAQTVKPSEIILVVDGPVPKDLNEIISDCEANEMFKVFRLPQNTGHGNARRFGLEKCSNELVALMDADDICGPDRFEQELKIFQNSDPDIVGGNIAEFLGDVGNIVAYRTVPQEDAEIKEYMKKRCPFNQDTVMFKKSSVEKAGGYIDWYCDEDYYLWLRMFLSGCRMVNTGTVLVYFRVGREMYKRRGGWKYFISETKLQYYMLKNKIIGLVTFFCNVAIRFLVQIAMPDKIRECFFKRFARTSVVKKQR